MCASFTLFFFCICRQHKRFNRKHNLRAKRQKNIVDLINKVRAAADGWAEGQGAVAQISVHLHKDNQAPRPTASQYR